jgi:hypothetical protein
MINYVLKLIFLIVLSEEASKESSKSNKIKQ